MGPTFYLLLALVAEILLPYRFEFGRCDVPTRLLLRTGRSRPSFALIRTIRAGRTGSVWAAWLQSTSWLWVSCALLTPISRWQPAGCHWPARRSRH